jgi:hypothetical protein
MSKIEGQKLRMFADFMNKLGHYYQRGMQIAQRILEDGNIKILAFPDCQSTQEHFQYQSILRPIKSF